MKTAVIYMRNATNSAESIRKQEDLCKQYAATHNLDVKGIYADVQASGLNEHRMMLCTMLRDINHWDVLLVSDLFRLSRNSEHLYKILSQLKQAGKELIIVMEGIKQ